MPAAAAQRALRALAPLESRRHTRGYKSTGLCVHAVYTRSFPEARSRALVGCTTHPRRPAAPKRPATPQLKYTRLLKRAQARFRSSTPLGSEFCGCALAAAVLKTPGFFELPLNAGEKTKRLRTAKQAGGRRAVGDLCDHPGRALHTSCTEAPPDASRSQAASGGSIFLPHITARAASSASRRTAAGPCAFAGTACAS